MDSFDLHYVLTNMENGVEGVGDSLREMLDDKDAVVAIEFLRQAYQSIGSIGLSRAAFFLYGARNTGRLCQSRASVHAYLNRLLEAVKQSS